MSERRFDPTMFQQACEKFSVKAVVVKLSQGAKPGRGGVLPVKKITAEISKIRGIAQGKDCISPAAHREFENVDEMLDFVEQLAELSGLPIGIKSAVGQMEFWDQLIEAMVADSGRAVDFIAIDGDGVRHDFCRTRGDVGDRMYPSPRMSHGALPNWGRHAKPVADTRVSGNR